jgi:hypothetical protein
MARRTNRYTDSTPTVTPVDVCIRTTDWFQMLKPTVNVKIDRRIIDGEIGQALAAAGLDWIDAIPQMALGALPHLRRSAKQRGYNQTVLEMFYRPLLRQPLFWILTGHDLYVTVIEVCD